MTVDNTPRERRERLMGQRNQGLILARGAARQGVNPNFEYLTGLSEPRGAMLLAADGVRIGSGRLHPGPNYMRGRIARQVLFLQSPDPMAARWGEDAAVTTNSVDAGEAGFDAILPISDFVPLLEQALSRSAVLHYVRGAAPRLEGEEGPDAALLSRIRSGFFDVELRDATKTVHEMRRIKDDGEVARIERAASVTADALERLLSLVRDGISENELEGEITRSYRSRGATHAFDPIVAAGANALLLHYTANSGRIAGGQILLVDTGAKLDGYCADVSRSYPVDGKFTDRQRLVYDAVLLAQREAIALCRPGKLLSDVHARAWEAIDSAGFGGDFIHGTSHHLGLETHDVGDVHRPLEPGCVVTVEPGIYLATEGLGVRIEDDVLVTDGAPRILTEAIPKDPDELERRMA
jgi:Xaa-Pro aminopeptidase